MRQHLARRPLAPRRAWALQCTARLMQRSRRRRLRGARSATRRKTFATNRRSKLHAAIPARFDCDDAEFRMVPGPHAGILGAARAERAVARPSQPMCCGSRRHAWQEMKAVPDDLLWARLHDTIRRNDAAIAHTHSANTCTVAPRSAQVSASAKRRRWQVIPDSIAVRDGSIAARSEARLLRELLYRQFPGCAMGTSAAGCAAGLRDRSPCSDYRELATRRSERTTDARTDADNERSARSDGSGSDATIHQILFVGDDVEAMLNVDRAAACPKRGARARPCDAAHGEFGHASPNACSSDARTMRENAHEKLIAAARSSTANSYRADVLSRRHHRRDRDGPRSPTAPRHRCRNRLVMPAARSAHAMQLPFMGTGRRRFLHRHRLRASPAAPASSIS